MIIEAAVTTIQDCEDSVAAVNALDKMAVYRNWNGLMKGTLEAVFCKGGVRQKRLLEPDRQYTAPDGATFSLPGRSLLLVRNVGLHMYTEYGRGNHNRRLGRSRGIPRRYDNFLGCPPRFAAPGSSS